MSDEYLDPPETSIEMQMISMGMGALAQVVERKSHDNGELDRFVMIDEESREEDEKRIRTAVKLGVLGEKQGGSVIYSKVDEDFDITFADVLDDDGNWVFDE